MSGSVLHRVGTELLGTSRQGQLSPLCWRYFPGFIGIQCSRGVIVSSPRETLLPCHQRLDEAPEQELHLCVLLDIRVLLFST